MQDLHMSIKRSENRGNLLRQFKSCDRRFSLALLEYWKVWSRILGSPVLSATVSAESTKILQTVISVRIGLIISFEI